MYQCEVTRFSRSRNGDMAVTFVPILFAFGLRGVLSTANIPRTAFLIIQVCLVIFVVAAFILSYWFYFRYFRYTVVSKQGDGRKGSSYPPASLTFERLINQKSRIYERVRAREMLCLLAPGEAYDEKRFGAPAKQYNLTALSASTAHRLYYRQKGIVYCALFHPNAEQVSMLQSWIRENQAP